MQKLYRLLFVFVFLAFSFAAIAQGRNVKGTIKDETGGGLPGVNIIIKGTSAGTATDGNGQFSLDLISEEAVLIFSAIGFESQEMVVGNQTTINLSMKPDVKQLDEVVVTGYSSQSKRDVTGAVATVSGETIAQQPVADVGTALQGRVAGVTVDAQGGPGNTPSIRVRGIGTLGNNDPLFVIDGVQTFGGLNLINQNDIETITVLKDAASCALYGARGSSGVIVITTKRGKTGAPTIEYNGYGGAEVPPKSPKMVSPQQYADAYWGYLKNSGLPLSNSLYGTGDKPVLPDYIIANTTATPFFGGVAANDPRADASNYNFENYRIMKANKSGTKWFDEVLGPARVQNHQLAVSGANETSNYAVTLNYLDNQGTLKNTYFKRYSLRVNTEFRPKKWLKIGENIQITYAKQNAPNDHTDQNAIAQLFAISPIMPVFDIGGHYTGTKGTQFLDGNNAVLGQVNAKNYSNYSARTLGSMYVEIEPTAGLTFQSRITVDFSPYESYSWKGIYPQNQYDNGKNQFFETAGNSLEWRSTNKVTYDKTFSDKHHVTAFAAFEASEFNSRLLYGQNDSLFSLSPGFLVLGTGAASTARVSGGRDKSRYISTFANVNYSFLDRYLFSATIRRDGSSKFGPQRRFGVFPSASAGWRISGENFMSAVNWVDELKIRASYGTTGNENSLPTGATVNQYATSPTSYYYDLNGTGNSSMPGFALQQIGNPFLQWEVNKTVNIGLDATIYHHLTASFNWFRRLTDKLISQPPATALQGDAFKPYTNVMNFVNKGVELELGYTNVQIGDFRINVNANIATYRNKVTYIDGNPTSFINGDAYARQAVLSRTMVGHPVSSFYGYVYDGIFQTNEEIAAHATQPGIAENTGLGHFKFKDISGPEGKPDGIIDQYDKTFIGNPHPKFTYGFNINATYKNFDLGIFIQGVYGNKVMNYWRTSYEWPGRYGIGSLDTWTPDNRGAHLPIYSNNVNTLDSQGSSYFVESGSYLRFQNVQLGYSFKQLAGIKRLRVYGQAYNLLTITKYSGLNPAVNTGSPGAIGIDFGGNYPISQKYLMGVNLTF